MKRFLVVSLVVIDAIFAFMIVTGRSNANIPPIEKVWVKTQKSQTATSSKVDSSNITMERILSTYGEDIKNAARAYNVSSRALAAIMYVESGGNPEARGDAGERGCMQILPSTAEMIGVEGNLFDCRFSILVAAKYLSKLQKEPHLDRTYKVVAAYNTGSQGVPKLSDNDHIADTKYLSKIYRAAQKIPEHW